MNARLLERRRLGAREQGDPMAAIANLFDAALVFALAFLLAMLAYHRMPDLLTQDEVTVIRNPGKANMEIMVKKGKKLEHYRAVDRSSGGRGTEIGTAYRLQTGEVIYVPNTQQDQQ